MDPIATQGDVLRLAGDDDSGLARHFSPLVLESGNITALILIYLVVVVLQVAQPLDDRIDPPRTGHLSGNPSLKQCCYWGVNMWLGKR